MLAAVILAAGESSRMGTAKALLPFPSADLSGKSSADSADSEKTFLSHLLAISEHPQIATRRVVVGAHAEAVGAAFPQLGDELVLNPEWQQGQLSSLKVAIRSLQGMITEGVIIFLADHPLVSRRLVNELIRRFQDGQAPVVVPTCKGRRGHPVIFSAAVFPELLSAPEDLGARAVVRAHAAEAIHVETDEEGILLNLNTPESLEQARAIVRARPHDFLI